MSKGPGTVERAVEAAFTASANSIFNIDDLVRYTYPGVNRAEKKHRVAVFRAAYRVADRLHWRGVRCERRGGEVVFYNKCDVLSYALGRLRSDFCYNQDDHRELMTKLEPGGKYWAITQPGGAWYKHVEIECLYRDGKTEEAKTASDAMNAPIKRMLMLR